MKKVCFTGEKKFIFGLDEISGQLGFRLDENGYKMTFSRSGKGINIDIKGHTASVRYGNDGEFFRAFSLALQYVDGKDRHIEASCDFERFGTMQNCSAAVMSPDGVKELIRQSALMGYTYLELYTETSYETDGEPYFGYMKGRYGKGELKELVSYAEKFFVELVPAIQTLGHMAELFKWNAYYEVKDIERIMLADFERTYKLIDNMLKTLAECYNTPHINLGMDEAYFMGAGRYHWFVDDSKPDMSAVFLRHLKRVLELAKKHGFTKPAIWYDNLFEMNYKGYIAPPEWLYKEFANEITDNFPEVRLIFWNYVITDVNEFERIVGYIRTLSADVSFASMAHGYTSFAPENYITERLVETAKNGCARTHISDMMITWWGSVQSPCALLPSYYNYIEKCGKSEGYDFDERCRFLFGYTYSEFCMLDMPNRLSESAGATGLAEGNNPPFYILADDPLLGIAEKHIPVSAKEFYENLAVKLKTLSERDAHYAYIFRFEAALCETLAAKCALSAEIKAAYDKRDLAALKAIAKSLPQTARRLKQFHSEYRAYWLTFNKSMGWEIWDNRIGGLITRLETVASTLFDYADGKIPKIEELEQERLPVSANADGKVISASRWNYINTTSI